VLVKMKTKVMDISKANAPLMEVKVLIATLSYAIVPTIWCCGSQGNNVVAMLQHF
jgi:hypothetical protein